jgi:hypothetical protein
LRALFKFQRGSPQLLAAFRFPESCVFAPTLVYNDRAERGLVCL